MIPHEAERRHLERQIALVRPVIQLMALVALVELKGPQDSSRAAIFLVTYLGFSVLVLVGEYLLRGRDWHVPLVVDLAALAVLLVSSPSIVPIWFPYLFVVYAAGIRWGFRWGVALAGISSLALWVRTFERGELHWLGTISSLGLVACAIAGGTGLAFLGDHNRRHAADNEFLARLASTFQVEQGLAESLRLMLDELANEFQCESALLAYRDAELERVFLWRVKMGKTERMIPENLPLLRAEGYLLDDLHASVCWNALNRPGEGFGWDRRNGRAFKHPPRSPQAYREEDPPWQSLMSAAFEQQGQPTGRIFLLNGSRRFKRRDLERFERIARRIGPGLDNLFLLRHIRARAIEGERSRISRDLHDGILQTLLSVEMQLDVMRRKLPGAVEQVAASLANLQQTVRNESAELRHMVTDLRPLRVQSADLVDLMRGFAERFCNESDLAVDLLIDSARLQAPDRVCRELFQIYREALNNIKKHAKASHVVVKLSQDDSRIVLVVDDNGDGFSFAGSFTGDELDRLRLGPISIKERTRTVGGILTVESSPGHGARLTVEIPLG
jgi:signal transduction histidine kinase